MKATRSSSLGGSARRRGSFTTEKKEVENDPKSLRRSTRDRELANPRVPLAHEDSPKLQRSRRRAKGPLVSSQRGEAATVAVDLLVAPAKRGKEKENETRSALKGNPSKSARQQQEPQEQRHLNQQEKSKQCMTVTASVTVGGRYLTATQENGKLVLVRLIVCGLPFTHGPQRQSNPDPQHQGSSSMLSPTIVGQDGNLFYCVVCHGFGDVVCCDMCPYVYHPNCIPLGSESRLSLENDDDPWFCPECMMKRIPVKQEPPISLSEGSIRRTIKHRCRECQQTKSELSLRLCENCAVYVHHPSCSGSTSPSEVVLCSICRAEAALTRKEQELLAKKKRRLHEEEVGRRGDFSTVGTDPEDKDEGKRRRRILSICADKPKDDDTATHGDTSCKDEGTDMTSEAQKRVRNADGPDDITNSEVRRKRKKKHRNRNSDAHLTRDQTSVDMDEASCLKPPRDEALDSRQASYEAPPPTLGPPTHATPAFHFYLAEQRPKIEKLLSRKHRYFNRLPKGGERNALIAKEAAKQWVKLSSFDQKKYINMSMHDYESRIIAWKEEKNNRDMLVEPEATTEVTDVSATGERATEDLILTQRMHERLYLGTSVGSKPYKPEADQSHNRVLLDLLRDMRFHPLPMLSFSRAEAETVSSFDSNKVSILHFDVHGPIATSVGDECLGCTRGWPHFCPVLQRSIPAIEHRSKLQPAASALISSRVGLGLRPRLERTEAEEEEENNPGNREALAWREAPDARELRNVRFVPSGTLTDPSARADDIVRFIEEVLAMKIPVPPRPPIAAGKQEDAATPKKWVLARGTLPTRQKRPSSDGPTDAAENSSYETLNKCGRCRTIVMNESGCVQCRRAQLVINMSKRQSPAEQDHQKADKPDLVKLQTAMLGRVITKEAIGEKQAQADKKISGAILRERWAPCTIMPPTKILAPSSYRGQLVKGEDSSANQDVSYKAAHDDRKLEQDPLPRESSGGTHGRSRAGPRSKRTSAAPAAFESSDADRQIVARRNREEADKMNKRTLSIACHGILLGLMRRDPLLLFAQPVTADGYSSLVKKPIDFSKIRSKVLQNTYHSLAAFVADVRLLSENALIFNPPGSIYSRTAKEILDELVVMQRRASKWMSAIKNSQSSFWRKSPKKRKQEAGSFVEGPLDISDILGGDPFRQLRQTWPEAVEMYEDSDWMKNLLTADFSRTRENEAAYYGSLAVRRAAKAAEVCLAPYPDTGGVYAAVVKRSEIDDEGLRHLVDSKISQIVNPIQLREIATGREETIVRLLRRVQNRRLERRIGSENGCARCDGMCVDQETKAVMNADSCWGRSKKKGESESESRVAASRLDLTTGLASAKTRARIARLREKSRDEALKSVNDVCVSLRGSRIHGWGLFAEQSFKKGDVVAEYVGECVGLPVADAREKLYQDMRIKDYQFRLDDSQIIDATMKGGLGRYINHNCNPNCMTKILPGYGTKGHLRRVLILAQRDISPREELTYDYQFPLELNLEARIPCNCQSDVCRGFMNWDLPEKGANTGALRTQKRGANMRDRIRRLGRPLKK